MGSLTLPARGPIYLDAQIFIYSIENHPTYAPLLRPLWQLVQAGTQQVISSELTLMETLVAPYRRADSALADQYEHLFQRQGVQLKPIDLSSLREAARLRASIPSLRTPDAIHCATGRLYRCAQFLTNDHTYRKVPRLPLVVLSDLATP